MLQSLAYFIVSDLTKSIFSSMIQLASSKTNASWHDTESSFCCSIHSLLRYIIQLIPLIQNSYEQSFPNGVRPIVSVSSQIDLKRLERHPFSQLWELFFRTPDDRLYKLKEVVVVELVVLAICSLTCLLMLETPFGFFRRINQI